MKKYEKYTVEELKKICDESESYREVAQKIGYNPDGGSYLTAIKEMVKKYNLDISHFKGQGHTKNLGKHRTSTEQYLNNEVKITSFKLRNRLIEDGYFERKCCSCGLTTWLDEPIPLELHHKDGNKYNNSLSNLELRCPNCHYFTDTYKTKNIK